MYSKWSDKDLLLLSETNMVANMYEMLGLYVSYSHVEGNSAFYDYYIENVGVRPFHFRNIGERKVKEFLQKSSKSIPRRNFRFLSRTWAYIPIIASDDMDIIFSGLVDLLYSKEDLKRVFLSQSWTWTPVGLLGFWDSFSTRYLRTNAQINSTKKLKMFKSVFLSIESNYIFTNK